MRSLTSWLLTVGATALLCACGGQTTTPKGDENGGDSGGEVSTPSYSAGNVGQGKTQYNQLCSGCHLETGRSEAFKLNSELSHTAMVDIIRDKMPTSAPEACGQACAENTAAYIKDVLFANTDEAPLTQPPLTARLVKSQYINTLEDLFGISLTADEIAMVPDELIDEKSFVTVFDTQPLQAQHARAYALVSRAVSKRISLKNLASETASCTDTGRNCRVKLVANLGKRLFRRPLTDNEADNYTALFAEVAEIEGANFDDALAATLRAMLQAPQFIYRTEQEVGAAAATQTVDGYELASRLSYFIWQSSPDEALLEFADKINNDGFRLSALEAEVERLFSDPKSARAMDTFWSDYILSSSSAILDASAEKATELRQSVLRTLKRASGHDGAAPTPLQQTLTSQQMVLTEDIAESLGLRSQGNGYRVYDVSDADQRVGFLTHPGFLANIGSTSFVGRGTILTERVLCRKISPPPSSISDKIDDTSEKTLSLTPREASDYRFGLGGVCLDCHQRFEPIAFAFEQFDVLGKHTPKDAEGRDLFTHGYLQQANGTEGPGYEDAYGLMSLLEQSNEVSECFVSNMFLFGTGREFSQSDKRAVTQAHQKYMTDGGTYESLLKAVALSPLFRTIQITSK